MLTNKAAREVCAVGLLASTLMASAIAGAATTEQITKENIESVLYIHAIVRSLDGTKTISEDYGSGFVISRDGYAITAAHVIPMSGDEVILQIDGYLASRPNEKLPLQYLKRDEYVALLHLPDPGANSWKPVLRGDGTIVEQGANLVALGFETQRYSPSPGVLRSKYGTEGIWQTSMPINHGDSGGPVFDSQGTLVGMSMGGYEVRNDLTTVIPERLFRPYLDKGGERIANKRLGIAENVDRPGGNLRQDFAADTVELCQSVCERDPKCVAFVLRKQGEDFPGCYLKKEVKQQFADTCCTTGVFYGYGETIPIVSGDDHEPDLSQPKGPLVRLSPNSTTIVGSCVGNGNAADAPRIVPEQNVSLRIDGEIQPPLNAILYWQDLGNPNESIDLDDQIDLWKSCAKNARSCQIRVPIARRVLSANITRVTNGTEASAVFLRLAKNAADIVRVITINSSSSGCRQGGGYGVIIPSLEITTYRK